MLRYIYLIGIITVIRGANIDNVPNVRVVKTVSSSISSEPAVVEQDGFETAHKITENREFETAHKITNERPIIKLLEEQDGSAGSSEDLMQQQNPQNLLSTKERPELNPVLSALINEDVMKSIESKRAIEESIEQTATPATVNILTTSQQPIKASDDDVLNEGLVDQSVNLEEAGSESNQKSRIQIKKGPNGVDYEYEYVYYYYDEDEKNEKGSKQKGQTTGEATAASRESSARGKSRYTNIERSTTSTPDNEIVGRGRGRSNAAATVADVEEGRLPQNTRFPPRNRGGDVTPAPEAAEPISEKNGRRTGVKRPSLDLVDNDTFNTDEKQVKSNRNIESELNKKTSEAPTSEDAEEQREEEIDPDIAGQTTSSDSEVENTTPLMEKAALDLYAIIANENFNMDSTTGDSVDVTTTDVPTTSAEELTTIMEEEPTTTTTTTTTTTPEPTTTTTTTTTTTPAPGRRGIGSGGRNRFRLKNGSTTTTTTEAPAEGGKPAGKTKGRFGGRPAFGSGRTPRPSKETKDEVKEEAHKEEAKPSSSSSLRGRTRNRFNLRGGSSGSTTEKSTDDNTIESKPASSTTRSRPARPQLNLRGRGRPGATTTPATSDSENEADAEKPTQATASVARPSRFNLGRPAGGANRLLPRGRINPLKPAPAAAAKEPAEGEPAEKKDEEPSDGDAAPAPASTDEESPAAGAPEDKPAQDAAPAAGGLNRLKNRPKIQITQKTAKAPAPVIVRKPNPLIGRRRIGASSSTTEAPASEDAADAEGGDDENVAGDSEDPKDEAASVSAPQIVEAASEQPARGLGLLANRRRLPLRKPGTLN